MKASSLISMALLAGLIFPMAACNSGGDSGANGDDTSTVMSDTADNEGRSGMSYRDEDFVIDVLETNAEELALLRQAANMGTDAEVKSEAQKMMSTHQQIDRDMRDYASKKNMMLDNVDTTADMNINEDKGNDWDEEWADEIGDMHKRLVRRYERAQDRVSDTELKSQISKNLPDLRAHLQTVENLETRLDKKQQ